ncbi:hypothetical protein [Runella sp.]|uniref:hypothetical protein n=1 Tax=Runella sp. TaxID=1960881 RepID=UPI003D101A50
MKHLLLIATILFLLCCKGEQPITPATITSLEYGMEFGFSGARVKIIVYPEKQIAVPDMRPGQTCEIAVSPTEWNELTSLFDEAAFKKVKVGEERICPDAGSEWIIARSSQREIQAVWGGCTGGDSKPIQPLVNALQKRRQLMLSTCM